MSLLCLAVWLPATQHCALEKLPGLAFLQCAGDAEGRPDCSGDSCDAVERGAYKVPDSSDTVATLVPIVISDAPVLIAEPAEPAKVAALDLCESAILPEAWQFYSALAVPIRGPSLLS